MGAITEIEKTFSKGGGSGIGKYVLQYTYDELDRLTSSSVDGVYTYDALGNIANRGGVYNLNNELLEDNDFIYSYTVNGELSQKVSKETGEKTIYSWNIEGKLTQVVIKDNQDVTKTAINYAYDGLDRRVVKTVNNVTTKYAYDSEDIIAEFDENNKLKALYLHGPGIDDPIMMARDINKDETFSEDELFFYSKDHLGSVHELTDINMKPIQRYNYLAYGETKLEKVDGVDHFIKNPYAYTSREWEEETGDYYYRARYYDSSTGRFLSQDPIGFRGGDSNLYRYCGNDPVNCVDPSGTIGFGAAIGIGAVVGGFAGVAGEIIGNNNYTSGSLVNAFVGGAAFGATTVLTAGSSIVTAAGVTLAQAAAGVFAGLTVGTAVNLITTPETRPTGPITRTNEPNMCK